MSQSPRKVAQNKKLPIGKKILKTAFSILTSVKQGKISYSENNGQMLPGYTENIGFLGGAPTSFAFGSQVDIRNKALENGWFVTRNQEDNYYNKTFKSE